ncbi:hypothetical protein AAMO2058_000643100 [Amorphochlora amoebiformis]
MRFKNRYLHFTIVTAQGRELTATGGDIVRLIRQSIQGNFGDFGMGRLQQALSVKQYDSKTGKFILKTTRDGYRMAWAAVSFISSIDSKPVQIVCQKVSGRLDDIKS